LIAALGYVPSVSGISGGKCENPFEVGGGYMTLLAIWFPSVGTFTTVLAVGGAIISLMNFTDWKRIALVSLCILLGIGELVSIKKASDAHDEEVRNQSHDAESVREELRRSEMRRQVENAILQTKLEDYAALSPLARATMKLAEVSAEFERRQYQAKVKSDHDRYEMTMKIVKKIRDFVALHDQAEEQQRQQAVWLAHGQKNDRDMMIESMNRIVLLSRARSEDFLKLILPEAAYIRSELLKSGLPPPTLDATETAIVNAALTRGSLAGPNPELTVAAYLEIWVKPLTGK